jgi:hypothetical protein
MWLFDSLLITLNIQGGLYHSCNTLYIHGTTLSVCHLCVIYCLVCFELFFVDFFVMTPCHPALRRRVQQTVRPKTLNIQGVFNIFVSTEPGTYTLKTGACHLLSVVQKMVPYLTEYMAYINISTYCVSHVYLLLLLLLLLFKHYMFRLS